MIQTFHKYTTQTTNFSILVETFIHTIYIMQLQQPVHWLKMEILLSQYTNETTKTTMEKMLTTTFLILTKNIHAYDL